MPFYQTEALSWLKNNKSESLGYYANEISIENVNRLYAAGAAKVDVVVKYSGLGEASAFELEVTFPKEGTAGLLEVIRSLHPDNWEDRLHQGGDPYIDDGSYAGEKLTLLW
ncbi:MAG TPA: hypothetical protein VJR06_03725 [Nitrososphaerales archaeon]|nr:hypothetical protein [Nitrososphaerales archaeon]